MIEFKLDIPALKINGIQFKIYSSCLVELIFSEVKIINSKSTNNKQVMIKMLILLNDTFNKGAAVVVKLTNAVTLFV